MKRTKSDVGRLIAELRLDSEALDDLGTTNARAQKRIEKGASDSLDYAALGYTIHNVYGVMENACLRIAKFFENGLSADSWHKDLLRRMLLDIPGTRPALLSDEAHALLDDLRGFRHIFRNLYNRPLDVDKLLLVQGKVGRAIKLFQEALKQFEAFLAELQSGIED